MVDFLIEPHFFIPCAYRKAQLTEKKEVEELSEELKQLLNDVVSVSFQRLFEFSDDDGLRLAPGAGSELSLAPTGYFDAVGLLEITLKPGKGRQWLARHRLLHNSAKIQSYISTYNAKTTGHIKMDWFNLPFVVNIASKLYNEPSSDYEESSSSSASALWTKHKILQHKELIGNWVEFYDTEENKAIFSEDYLESRVEGNMSDRLTEMIYLKLNSAFIFIDSTVLGRRRIQTIKNDFIKPVYIFKCLRFVFLSLVNPEIDRIEMMGLLSYVLSGKYQEDIVGTSWLSQRLKDELKLVYSVDGVLSRLWAIWLELAVACRTPFETKVITACNQVFGLDQVHTIIKGKIQHLRAGLEEAATVVRHKAVSGQKKLLGTMQHLGKLQVVVTVVINAVVHGPRLWEQAVRWSYRMGMREFARRAIPPLVTIAILVYVYQLYQRKRLSEERKQEAGLEVERSKQKYHLLRTIKAKKISIISQSTFCQTLDQLGLERVDQSKAHSNSGIISANSLED